MHTLENDQGYSLIELLVALAILAITLGWAAPAVSGIVGSVRVYSGAEALQNSLQLARSEAIRRNGRVVMCTSSAGSECEHDGGWERGWIVFQDANNNRVLDAEELLLYREQGVSDALHMSGNGPVREYVSYNPYGKTKLTSGAFQAGSFTVCTTAGGEVLARRVIINNSGRVRTARAELDECA